MKIRNIITMPYSKEAYEFWKSTQADFFKVIPLPAAFYFFHLSYFTDEQQLELNNLIKTKEIQYNKPLKEWHTHWIAEMIQEMHELPYTRTRDISELRDHILQRLILSIYDCDSEDDWQNKNWGPAAPSSKFQFLKTDDSQIQVAFLTVDTCPIPIVKYLTTLPFCKSFSWVYAPVDAVGKEQGIYNYDEKVGELKFVNTANDMQFAMQVYQTYLIGQLD